MRIHEVVIQVGDVEEAIAFYTRVVGLKHVRSVEHEGAWVAELEAEGQRVTLVPSEHPGVVLALETPSALSRKRRLARHEVPVEDGVPLDVPGGSWLPFTDPWGNRLGFWEDRPGEAGSEDAHQ